MPFTRHLLPVLVSAMPALALTAGSAAAGPFEAVFGQRDLSACFYRDYDGAHLATHPKQRTRIIEIDMTPPDTTEKPFTPEHFELGVGIMARTGNDWYTGNAICKTRDFDFSCYLEGDGGDIVLKPQPDGGMELTTDRLVLEGDAGYLVLGQGKTDDIKFLLRPATQDLCDAATADASGD